MSQANLDFLAHLFDVVESLTERADQQISFGLDEVGPTSSLAQDDVGMDGFKVSIMVMSSIGSALDHAITLRSLVTKAGEVTNAAPWTLLRGVIEPSSLAVWILDATSRVHRQERALRVWRHDMHERSNWEKDTGFVPTPPGKKATDRMKQIDEIVQRLGLRPQQVAQKLYYSHTVRDAGEAAGMPGAAARARWRECSGFAHGRNWSSMRLSQPIAATRLRDRDGAMVALTLNETHLEGVADLATTLLNKALSDYADAANG
ncbi:hypothetical protein [Nonomuraea roseoviolacea]|uniref:DUF222 domain-containing protein n=1 Tax=Nonomuraea roseoviolacea subsp. carminata TaxID=160689 RepID=A0ABT1KAI5_9ACTN|nr:hypothetical protein [Nonomuraea roseoviolacea]MCP2350602.1 hypothetical protein [Nonomuraea roseoviolacea subsp. carminata]